MVEIVDNFLDDDYDEKNDYFLDASLAAAAQDQAPTPSKEREPLASGSTSKDGMWGAFDQAHPDLDSTPPSGRPLVTQCRPLPSTTPIVALQRTGEVHAARDEADAHVHGQDRDTPHRDQDKDTDHPGPDELGTPALRPPALLEGLYRTSLMYLSPKAARFVLECDDCVPEPEGPWNDFYRLSKTMNWVHYDKLTHPVSQTMAERAARFVKADDERERVERALVQAEAQQVEEQALLEASVPLPAWDERRALAALKAGEGARGLSLRPFLSERSETVVSERFVPLERVFPCAQADRRGSGRRAASVRRAARRDRAAFFVQAWWRSHAGVNPNTVCPLSCPYWLQAATPSGHAQVYWASDVRARRRGGHRPDQLPQ